MAAAVLHTVQTLLRKLHKLLKGSKSGDAKRKRCMALACVCDIQMPAVPLLPAVQPHAYTWGGFADTENACCSMRLASHHGLMLCRVASGKLLQGLETSVVAAQEELAGSASGGRGRLLPAEAVQLAASLDGMYYLLLEHHLSTRGGSPAVPPPHLYFPAVAAAHPGQCSSLHSITARRNTSFGSTPLRRRSGTW